VPDAAAESPELAEPEVRPRAGSRPPTVATQRAGLYQRIARVLLIAAAAAIVPFVFDSYWVFTFTELMIYAIATIGLDIVFGRAGQLSLAQAAFFGLGGYFTALTVGHVNPVLQLLGVIGIAAAAGLVVAVPSLRLSGLRLALVTLLFSELFIWGINHWARAGGTQGLVVNPLTIAGFNSIDATQGYLFVLVFAVAASLITLQIERTQFGRRLLAVRDSEVAARSVGVSLVRTKVSAFVLSAIFAGVAGWLYAYIVGFVAPSDFDLFPSVYFLIAVILGGAGSVFGSWLGAGYIVLVPQAFSLIGQPNLFPILGGGILVVVALLIPGGLVDAINRLSELAKRGCGSLLRSVRAPGGVA
jgi:branched-chain amino acid transport system permease protein